MYKLTFISGSGKTEMCAEKGDNILELALASGLAVDSPCSGNGTCGKCRIRVISGEVDMEHSPRLSKADYSAAWRLACRSRVCADAVIELPDYASAYKTEIRTADLGSAEEMNIYRREIEGIFSGELAPDSCPGFGIAIDIGTTTVTAALLNLMNGDILAKASLGNAQIKFGADVINRIIRSSRPGGKEELRGAICEETLRPLLDALFHQSGISPENIRRTVISGNTTMEHLLVGADAQTIRLEPYVPQFLELKGLSPEAAGLGYLVNSEIILSPNVGSYVGGDITAGVLASGIWSSGETNLFIDLGTNGELVLGGCDYMLTCACSAGPAFEGGDISCGMRAMPGAAEACEINAETLEPKLSVIGGGKPMGLCGSGLIDTISELFRCGAISSKGRFIRQSPRIRYDEYGGASYVLAFAEESATGQDVEINESDLDNFIKAKAAVFSAIRTMLNSVGMTVDDIDRIILAGGIGSGIDISKAIKIGMLPALPLDKYSYIGNSSLTGSCAMLMSQSAEEKTFEIKNNMTYIELSTHPGYMDEFVAACFIPHTDAALFDD